MRIFFFITMILCFTDANANTNNLQKVADDVLQNLYVANGNYIFAKPSITITNNSTDAALFLRRANRIELSLKVFEVCRSMQKDSLAALAFIIGHELSHAYQKDLKAKSTSFLAYDHHHDESIFFEESADVQGAFMSYLAGYQTTEILPELIERIYYSFSLPEKLSGYPSLIERQSTTKKVVAMVEELVNIYEIGNYLLAIGEYQLAVDCYRHVETWYKGSEIYKNMAISYAYLALNFTNKNTEKFLFPLEINWTTRMNKPLVIPGGKDLNPEEERLKQTYLIKANNYISVAESMEPLNASTKINKVCILILQKKYQEAIDYYSLSEVEKNALFADNEGFVSNQAKLALALAFAYNQNYTKAEQIWNQLKNNGKGIIKTHAVYNLNALANAQGKQSKSSEINCQNFSFDEDPVDGVKIYRPDFFGEKIMLNEIIESSVIIKPNTNSILYNFKTSKGIFSIQRVLNHPMNGTKIRTNETSIFTNIGSISVCPENKNAFVTDRNGIILEWAKFYSE